MWKWIWCVWIPALGNAQNNWSSDLHPSGSLSYQSEIKNPFAFSNSNSGLAFITSSAYGISAENKYSIKGCSKMNLALVMKTKNGGWNIQGSFTGNELINGFQTGLGYGMRLSKSFGLGTGVRIRREQLRGFSPLYLIFPQLGFLYYITKKLNVGVHLHKSTQLYSSKELTNSRFNNLTTGIGYQIDNKIYTSVEIVNDMHASSYSTIYFEYAATDNFKTYILFKKQSNEIQVGSNWQLKKFNFGIGISNHTYLGNSGYLMIYHVL